MEWTIDDLLDRLQTRDECQRIEAKEAKRALGKSARESISAFSNEPGLGGGYLVLGLKCDEGDTNARYTVVGLDLSVMRVTPTLGIQLSVWTIQTAFNAN